MSDYDPTDMGIPAPKANKIDMSDDNFEDYQALRSVIEKEVRTLISEWFLAESPDDMTFHQLRALSEKVTVLMNIATKRCWELGKLNAARKQETKP